MFGSELLSKQHRYNIGEYKNLNRLTANTVTLDYLKFGMDTSNVTITYPNDLNNNGYTLVLPNRSGIRGEFLGIDDNNKLKWSNPNVIKNVQFKYGDGLNSSLVYPPYTKNTLITPDNYQITIKPISTTSKLFVQCRITYVASYTANSNICFELWKRIGNDSFSDTMIHSETDLGSINATGSNISHYVASSIIETGTTEEITIFLRFKFKNINLGPDDLLPEGINIGILGEDRGYHNSLIITEFEGSGVSSTLLSKSHDNESIYYNSGTLFLGSNFNSLNTNNISSLSLITEDGIRAPLLIGNLQGNIRGNYVITDNIDITGSATFNSNVDINGNLIFDNKTSEIKMRLFDGGSEPSNQFIIKTYYDDITNTREGYRFYIRNKISLTSYVLNGNIVYSTLENNSTTSDDRLKFNETPIINATSIIKKLNPIIYDQSQILNDDTDTIRRSGFIAQEVYAIPELQHLVISGTETEPWSLFYDDIIPYAVASIKEQETKISNLQAENSLLKSKLNEILSEMGKEII